ncbi:MAG: VanZ family protein [Halioglobus sp.]
MLESPPRESEAVSWTYVAAGVLVIYCTIPLARAFREAVSEQLGREMFLYVTLAIVSSVAIAAVVSLSQRKLPFNAYLCLLAIFVAFMAFVYDLRDIPEEAVHVVEYGGLGLLVYRALAHRVRDYTIYILGSLVVGMIGVLDEYIQWVVPSRYYELRDIGINFCAGALSQVAIFAGLRPGLITGLAGPGSWSRVCYVSAALLLLMSISFLNSPASITWYATRIPSLEFLMSNHSTMAEYGYRYEDRDTGVFRSRLDPEQLQRLNSERGEAAWKIMERYQRGEVSEPFLSVYSVMRDPYIHEIGVHVYRRNYHLDRARENSDKQTEHYTIAYRENQILRKYFTKASQYPTVRWSSETVAEVSSAADKFQPYESAVSASVITRVSQVQVMLLFAGSFILLVLLGAKLARIPQKKTAQ